MSKTALRALCPRAVRFCATFAAAALTASCGGGGDSASSGISVSYSPASVSATGIVEGFQQFTVTATFSNLPTGAVFAVITADTPVIIPADTSATQLSSNQFKAVFTINSQTAATYAGDFNLILCKDAQCESQYDVTGTALPYSITVLPQPIVSVTLGGVSLVPRSDGSYGGVDIGDVVTVTTNTPVLNWVGSNDYQVTCASSTVCAITFLPTQDVEVNAQFYTVGGLSSIGFEL
jgi:hypothetical protein